MCGVLKMINLIKNIKKENLKKILIVSLCVELLTSCTTQMYRQQDFSQAREFYLKPNIIQVPSKNTSYYHLTYGNDPALEHAFNRYAKYGTAPNIITSGFIKFAYNMGQQPVVKTTPFEETVISLETGERFTNVSSGDPNRWSYSVAVSGSGKNQQQNILVKPSLPNISTNMVITTDRRIYNLKLVSSMDSRSTRNVSFWFPEEMVNAINNSTIKNADESEVASVPNVSLNNLNFNYLISSDGFFRPFPSWKPTRIFDDGKHTYIQFPDDLSNRDMPVLFILNGDNKELVNYRSKPPYFVIDKIFKKAVLVIGVAQGQQQVFLDNNNYF
jgi:P-type conjugative transfer protein TrbG